MKTRLSDSELNRIRRKCGAFLSNEQCIEIHKARRRVKLKAALRMAGVEIPASISGNLEKLEELCRSRRLLVVKG